MAGEGRQKGPVGATPGKGARAGGIEATGEDAVDSALLGEGLNSPTGAPFAEVPVQPGTRVREVQELEIGGKSALWQRWHREGLSGETLVLMEAQVGHFVDDALRGLARESGLVRTGSAVIVTRHRNGYAFLSFNLLSSGRGGSHPTI